MSLIVAKKTRITFIGRDNFEKVLSALSLQAREIFSGVIVPGRWYDLYFFIEWCQACLDICYCGNEEEYLKGLVHPSMEGQFNLIFKSFLHFNKPEVVIKRIAYITGFYFQGITVDFALVRPQEVMLIYRGFEKQHRIIELLIKGWWEKVLELMGARDIAVKVTVSLAEDKGYSQFSVVWRD